MQQFFKFLLDEEEIDKSPMARVKQPQTPLGDDDTKKLLDNKGAKDRRVRFGPKTSRARFPDERALRLLGPQPSGSRVLCGWARNSVVQVAIRRPSRVTSNSSQRAKSEQG